MWPRRARRSPMARRSCMGAAGALIVSVGSAISMTGNNMGQVLTGSRTIFALAENGDLPRWFARVHPRHQTPSNAILFTAAVALALALTGSFVQLAAVSAVARLVMYLAVCTRDAGAPRTPADRRHGPGAIHGAAGADRADPCVGRGVEHSRRRNAAAAGGWRGSTRRWCGALPDSRLRATEASGHEAVAANLVLLRPVAAGRYRIERVITSDALMK